MFGAAGTVEASHLWLLLHSAFVLRAAFYSSALRRGDRCDIHPARLRRWLLKCLGIQLRTTIASMRIGGVEDQRLWDALQKRSCWAKGGKNGALLFADQLCKRASTRGKTSLL